MKNTVAVLRDRKFAATMKPSTLLVLVGPTAVGKTAVAVRLAQYFKTEVISADSRQVFREMEIGTAKPAPAERAAAFHHFVDTRSIFEGYDAGTYSDEVDALLVRLFADHTHVILSGGSGLYVKALLDGFDDLPEIPGHVRDSVVAEYESRGLGSLLEELRVKDPDYYQAVDQKNPQRLMRAIEVIRHSGKPFSGYHTKSRRTLPFEVIKIGLERERAELYQRINTRVEHMISQGLFHEAAQLFPHRHLPALQTVGYQEIFGHLEGRYDREEAIRLLKRNTRRYAKRQLTWFRKDKSIAWFHPDDWQGIISRFTSQEPSR